MTDLDYSNQNLFDIHVKIFDLYTDSKVVLELLFSEGDTKGLNHLTRILIDNGYSFKVEFNRTWPLEYLKENGVSINE